MLPTHGLDLDFIQVLVFKYISQRASLGQMLGWYFGSLKISRIRMVSCCVLLGNHDVQKGHAYQRDPQCCLSFVKCKGAFTAHEQTVMRREVQLILSDVSCILSLTALLNKEDNNILVDVTPGWCEPRISAFSLWFLLLMFLSPLDIADFMVLYWWLFCILFRSLCCVSSVHMDD